MLLFTVRATKEYLDVLNFKIAILINCPLFSTNLQSQNHAKSLQSSREKKRGGGTFNVPLPELKTTIR